MDYVLQQLKRQATLAGIPILTTGDSVYVVTHAYNMGGGRYEPETQQIYVFLTYLDALNHVKDFYLSYIEEGGFEMSPNYQDFINRILAVPLDETYRPLQTMEAILTEFDGPTYAPIWTEIAEIKIGASV